MKAKNILIACIACLALGGCKGNTWSSDVESSETSKSIEPAPKVSLMMYEPFAVQYKDVTWDYYYYFEDEEGTRLENKPVFVNTTDQNIAIASASDGILSVYSVETGNCTLTLLCEEYGCTFEVPVNVGPYGLVGVEITNAPHEIHVGDSYVLEFKTIPEEYKTQLSPASLYDSEHILDCTAYNFTIKANEVGHTTVNLDISLSGPSIYHGPTYAHTSFELDVVV